MRFDFTPLVRKRFVKIAERTDGWSEKTEEIQKNVLQKLLRSASDTEYLKKYDLRASSSSELYRRFSENVPLVEYEDIREHVMRMIRGERNVLWRGKCSDFAQSSGTSGGKSKYIPITADSLKGNHYRGAEDAVAHYLRNVGDSKIFSGKGFILGGSFSNTLGIESDRVKVGDLSATLINKIGKYADFVRIPDKKTALLSDWEIKLPALVKKASGEYVTNISGVPSWFLTVLRKISEFQGNRSIKEIWPGLEVFFHGGISFEPYRDEYKKIIGEPGIHYVETYNASEGFFGVQNNLKGGAMLLIIDRDVFYEFIPVDKDNSKAIPIWEVEKGKVYEMVISSSNGLWRYRLGDTVRIVETNPVKIRIAGRTRSFINAFGEELMEENAERAISIACDKTKSGIQNYTVAPLYSHDGKKGRHQWLIEWDVVPADIKEFATLLDSALREVNSDYDAKRSGSIFLDLPEIITAHKGLFDEWLLKEGSHKLGGQRKVVRLHNDRETMEKLLEMNNIKR